jgi:endonuclease-3
MEVAPLLLRLKEAYPVARTALRHENPLELLIATILSAQCTDERVNQVTPKLFERFPDAASLATADPEALEGIIRSTGFFRSKARSIRGSAQRIVEVYGGAVPRTMEDLLTLPGVARKTANVVMGSAYGVPSGIVVDTHVERIAHRLYLSDAKTPEKVELDLMERVPREEWIDFSHRLILHGRRVCLARAPRCGECPVEDLCPSAPLFLSGMKPTTRRDRTAGGRKARPAVAHRGDGGGRAGAGGKRGGSSGRTATAKRKRGGAASKAAAATRRRAGARKDAARRGRGARR